MDGSDDEEQSRDVEANVGLYCNGESEVVGDSNDMAPECAMAASVREYGDAEGVIVNNSKGSCWSRRIRIDKAEERDANPSRVLSLSKVYSLVGGFFGSVKEVPFTKRSLKTLWKT
uniref:Uncharacterized protein n=1 Tax=Triticum urartu TaxID=4572 RepID=A0A8R7R0M6_TRIUA